VPAVVINNIPLPDENDNFHIIQVGRYLEISDKVYYIKGVNKKKCHFAGRLGRK
jgi:hypothetical protein